MIDLYYFKDLPVAVLGLGKSGLSAARALQKSGADVWAWDDSEERRAPAAAEGIPLVNLTGCDWRELTSLVISPGIPHRLLMALFVGLGAVASRLAGRTG